VSDEEKNKALVRRLIEEVDNRGNLDVADELLAPNLVDHRIVAKRQTQRNSGLVRCSQKPVCGT
jgi:hypothetical protein